MTMSQPASSLQPPRPRVGASAWIQAISLALIALMMAMVLGYVHLSALRDRAAH